MSVRTGARANTGAYAPVGDTGIVPPSSGTRLAGLFPDVPEVVDLVAAYLWIIPLSSGMVGVVLVAEETLNAVGKPVEASAQKAIHIVVLYGPLAFIGSHLGGFAGLLIGIVAADALGVVASAQMVRHISSALERDSSSSDSQMQ